MTEDDPRYPEWEARYHEAIAQFFGVNKMAKSEKKQKPSARLYEFPTYAIQQNVKDERITDNRKRAMEGEPHVRVLGGSYQIVWDDSSTVGHYEDFTTAYLRMRAIEEGY